MIHIQFRRWTKMAQKITRQVVKKCMDRFQWFCLGCGSRCQVVVGTWGGCPVEWLKYSSRQELPPITGCPDADCEK